jgi:hypothetical protein
MQKVRMVLKLMFFFLRIAFINSRAGKGRAFDRKS